MVIGAACLSDPTPAPPAAGLVLLGLQDGTVRGQTQLGEDPVALAVSADGRAAYVADNRPGVVYAVALPDLTVQWKTVVGGRPGPILVGLDFLFVSLYDAGKVAELDAKSGALVRSYTVGPGPGQLVLADGRVQVACGDGRVYDLEGHSLPAGHGFALSAGPGGLWTSDYTAGALVRIDDGRRVQLPAGLHAFWLAQGSPDRLLVAAEGDDEDRDLGAILAMGSDLNVARLAQAHDPDLVLEHAEVVYAASHGDREVTVAGKGKAKLQHWLHGSQPVALAPDPGLGLLLVVTNAGE